MLPEMHTVLVCFAASEALVIGLLLSFRTHVSNSCIPHGKLNDGLPQEKPQAKFTLLDQTSRL
ncbi:hypothetical protein BR93DRAFT_233213 [Coniochaeta sp. PMI_546]|nr:hypothetical protein BR93DRAFT_233213 [Coniochaeta sp. PMI_546]